MENFFISTPPSYGRKDLYTRIFNRESKSPKAFSSHMMRTITTTTLRILLTVDCMGMNELISHKTTPATIITITIVSSDIILILNV